MARPPESKLVSLVQLATLCEQLHQEKLKIVTTNGCFDLLHRGHTEYLAQAKALGDALIVGINSDASVRHLKGPSRPLQDQETRALQLAALESVDWVTIFEEPTPHPFLEIVRPAIHVKGGDYQVSDLPEREVVQRYQGEVRCLPLVPGFSTTQLIEKIRDLFSTPK